MTEEIIDAHCHVASSRYTPRSFSMGVASNMLVALEARGIRANLHGIMSMLEQRMQDHHADGLVREMESAGIAHSVLLCPDFSYALSDCQLTIAEMFEEHAAILRRHPGTFTVLAGVDPRWGSDAVVLFERGLRDLGFGGCKLYPPCGYSPADRSLYPVYELCAAYGVPVLTHVGATSPALTFEEARPELIDRPARDFPSVNFILAHASVAYRDSCLMLAANRPNVYLDVSGFAGAPMESLRAMFSARVNHKLLFGTDWPVHGAQEGLAGLVEQVVLPDGPLRELNAMERAGFLANQWRRIANRRCAEAGATHAAATVR